MAPRPLSPLWWLEKLSAELSSRQDDMKLMDDYYEGDHPLPFLTNAHNTKMRNEFKTLLEDSRSNFMQLVVDVVEERLRVEGFRLSASQDAAADEDSWRIWQDNQLDADSQTAFVEALVKGVSYLSVWAGKKDGDSPTIAVEDPTQTIVGYEPGSNFRRRAAALKVWTDDWTGMERANVYLPAGIYKFEATREPDGGLATPAGAAVSTSGGQPSRWKELEREFVKNDLGIVPIIPLRNRPRLLVEGRSEIKSVYRVQNQINGFLFLLALAGYFGAHKQRWAIGLTLTTDDNGNPKEPYDIAVDRLLTDPNPDAKFGEFEQTSLDGYINAIEQKVSHIAVTTRTPKHYMLPEGQEPSGDSIKSADSGLVKKAERKMRPFGEGLEEALRLARRFAGKGESPPDSEIVWADPQIRTEAETTDAAIKQFQGRLIPWNTAVQKLGYSQTEIARMLTEFGGTAPTPAPPASTPEVVA